MKLPIFMKTRIKLAIFEFEIRNYVVFSINQSLRCIKKLDFFVIIMRFFWINILLFCKLNSTLNAIFLFPTQHETFRRGSSEIPS